MATGGAAYAVAAVALGVPVGLFASPTMQDAVGRSTGIGPGYASAPTIGAVAMTVVVFVAAAAGLAALAARRAAQAPVADILRSE